MWWILLILLFSSSEFIKLNFANSSEEDFCTTNNSDISCNNLDQDYRIILKNIEEDIDPNPSQIFFIESLGRDHLLPKHVCTIESALRNANVSRIVVAMTSKSLHVSANNVTRQLFQKYSNNDGGNKKSTTLLLFRHVDVDILFKNTNLEDIHLKKTLHVEKVLNERLKKDQITAINYSDAIRLVLIQKYGGWYADLDIVFLKSLHTFEEGVLGCDNVPAETKELVTGTTLTNAMFHMVPGHPFMTACIEKFSKTFDGSYASGGPRLFQYVSKVMCKVNSEICEGITVVPSKYFFPVPWQGASMLFENKNPEFWDEFFQNSYAVHYYDSSVNGRKMNRIQQPRFFGKEMPALTYLSLSHCPIALHSQ